jgi:ABC-2 type transport system ATP-binding protein
MILAPSPAELLKLDGLWVAFDTLLAVKGVSLSLRAGEILGLIGPNGAGKTTLLRAAAGIQPILRGSVHVLGEALVGPDSSLRRHLGFTPDTPPVYEAMTVRDFLTFIARGYSLSHSEARERIDFWLEKVWLTEKGNQKISTLSRGMRQRIGLARTLIPDPHVVLLDEPAAGLDPAGRVQFRELLRVLGRQGKAIIISSHILSDMAEYCTHIGIMAKGSLVQHGTIGQVAAAVSSMGDTGRRRYAVQFASSVTNAAEILREMDGVFEIEANHQAISFEFSGEPLLAAGLLAQLVGRGLPIAAFSPLSHDLEAAYLRSGIAQVD